METHTPKGVRLLENKGFDDSEGARWWRTGTG